RRVLFRSSLREDEQSCGDPVETMDGYEVRQIEVDAQAGDDAFANEPAVGGAGEEMRLVDDEQVLVLEHDADREGDPLLGRDRTREEVEPPWRERIIPGHRAARLVEPIAFGPQAPARARTRHRVFGFEPLPYRVGNGQVVLRVGGPPAGGAQRGGRDPLSRRKRTARHALSLRP